MIHILFPTRFLFFFFWVEQLLDVNEDAKLTAFEKAGIENYLHRNLIIAKNQIDVKVAATGERYLCRCRLICRIYIILSLILHMIHRSELLILYFHVFFSQFAGSKRLLKTWIAWESRLRVPAWKVQVLCQQCENLSCFCSFLFVGFVFILKICWPLLEMNEKSAVQ